MNRRIPNLSRVFQAGSYGRPNAPLTPLAISSLAVWFSPDYGKFSDAGTTPAAAEDAWYRWYAKYPADDSVYLDAATLANRPILKQASNGKYYADLNGTSHHWVANSNSVATLAGDFTIWALANITAATGDRYICSKQLTAAPYTGYGLDRGYTGTKLLGEVSDGTYTSKAGTTSIDGSAGWRTYAMKRASTTATLYIAGTSDGSGAVQGGSTSAAIALNVGRFTGAGATYFQGGLSHLVFLSDDYTDAERALLETFAAREVPA